MATYTVVLEDVDKEARKPRRDGISTAVLLSSLLSIISIFIAIMAYDQSRESSARTALHQSYADAVRFRDAAQTSNEEAAALSRFKSLVVGDPEILTALPLLRMIKQFRDAHDGEFVAELFRLAELDIERESLFFTKEKALRELAIERFKGGDFARGTETYARVEALCTAHEDPWFHKTALLGVYRDWLESLRAHSLPTPAELDARIMAFEAKHDLKVRD